MVKTFIFMATVFILLGFYFYLIHRKASGVTEYVNIKYIKCENESKINMNKNK